MDGAAVQHFLNVLAHLIHQGRSDMVKPFLEWLILHKLDDVFSGICAPDLIRLQGEDVVEFQQQGYCLLGQLGRPFFKAIQPTVLSKGGQKEVLPLLR